MNYIKKKGILLSPGKYFIDALGAMALGLFASLLIGTIFGTVADYVSHKPTHDLLMSMNEYAVAAQGPAMAMAIGSALGAGGLLLFSLLLGLADRFLFSDLLVFPLRLILHYVGTAVGFWLLFGVMGGYEGSGLTVWLIYTFAYALIMTIVMVYRWLTADLRNQKQDYSKKFENDDYKSNFGG